MELDDVFYLGKRPTTLRMVLGLMEDAETSLETYRWAVPALMRSFDTNDRQLYKYVEDGDEPACAAIKGKAGT